MTTHTDLIARLRRGWTTDCLLAADALEALEQQVAALTNERNDLLILLDNWKTSQGVTEDQLAAAQARESKLREALEYVGTADLGCSDADMIEETLAAIKQWKEQT